MLDIGMGAVTAVTEISTTESVSRTPATRVSR